MTANVIGLLLLVIMIGVVAIPLVMTVNTSSWDTNTKTVWNVVPVGLALAVLIGAFFLVRA